MKSKLYYIRNALLASACLAGYDFFINDTFSLYKFIFVALFAGYVSWFVNFLNNKN
jgi:hypothetical protein